MYTLIKNYKKMVSMFVLNNFGPGGVAGENQDYLDNREPTDKEPMTAKEIFASIKEWIKSATSLSEARAEELSDDHRGLKPKTEVGQMDVNLAERLLDNMQAESNKLDFSNQAEKYDVFQGVSGELFDLKTFLENELPLSLIPNSQIDVANRRSDYVSQVETETEQIGEIEAGTGNVSQVETETEQIGEIEAGTGNVSHVETETKQIGEIEAGTGNVSHVETETKPKLDKKERLDVDALIQRINENDLTEAAPAFYNIGASKMTRNQYIELKKFVKQATEQAAVAEQVAEQAAEQVAEQVAEPAVEPAAEPAAQPAAQPAAEQVAEQVAQPAAQPAAEQVAEQVAQPAAQPAAWVNPDTQEIANSEADRKKKVNTAIKKYRGDNLEGSGKKGVGVETVYEKNAEIKKLYDTTINVGRKSTVEEIDAFNKAMDELDSSGDTLYQKIEDVVVSAEDSLSDLLGVDLVDDDMGTFKGEGEDVITIEFDRKTGNVSLDTPLFDSVLDFTVAEGMTRKEVQKNIEKLKIDYKKLYNQKVAEGTIIEKVVDGVKKAFRASVEWTKEKSAQVADWLEEILGEPDLGEFVGVNGETIVMEFNKKTGIVSADTPFLDGIMDFDMEGIEKELQGEPTKDKIIEIFNRKQASYEKAYNEKVITNALKHINTATYTVGENTDTFDNKTTVVGTHEVDGELLNIRLDRKYLANNYKGISLHIDTTFSDGVSDSETVVDLNIPEDGEVTKAVLDKAIADAKKKYDEAYQKANAEK